VWADDVAGTLDQQRSQVSVAGFGDCKLWVALAGLDAPSLYEAVGWRSIASAAANVNYHPQGLHEFIVESRELGIEH
jgi:hypothetical protein